MEPVYGLSILGNCKLGNLHVKGPSPSLMTSRGGHRDSDGCKFGVPGWGRGQDLGDVALFLPITNYVKSTDQYMWHQSAVVRIHQAVSCIKQRTKYLRLKIWFSKFRILWGLIKIYLLSEHDETQPKAPEQKLNKPLISNQSVKWHKL